ncbi:MAG: hypothetical protein GPJ54_21000 [Candidatus Heimdallarchaeota archaeon]|nr:hypothetical protein [Candidatus Heimdallarchaeota archaeon]
MKTNFKTVLIILSLLFSGIFLFANFSRGAINPIQNVFWLGEDDGYAMNVTTLDFGGNTEIPDESGGYLREGEIFYFGFESIPTDWLTNPFEYLNVSQYVSGSLDSSSEVDVSSYVAPWLYNATTLYNESAGLGPPLLIPAMPLPFNPADKSNFYSEITTEFVSHGFTVSEDSDYIRIYANNLLNEDGTFSVETTVSKGIGLMHNYTYSDSLGNILQLEFHSVLSPSNFPLSWHAEDPVLSYEILTANGTNGFSFEVNNPSDSPYEPQWGEGTAYQGQLLQMDLGEFRGFDVDGPAGYELTLHTETGGVHFNISLELPSSDPRNNTFYLYPLFPVASRTLIDAYFAFTYVANDNYTYSIVNDLATINFDDGNDSLTATWDLNNGVLQYWKLNQLNQETNTRSTLEFQLISFATLTDLGPYWGQTTGVAHTYVLESLNTTTGHQLDLSEDTNGHGYIAEGESIYFDLINNSVFGDASPLQLNQDNSDDGGDGPMSYYNLGGPNGGSVINIRFAFPGDTNWDGPPMLYPHLLLGTTDYFDWAKTQYGWAGLTFDYDSTTVWFDWAVDFEGTTGRVYAEWDKTTGVLQEYLVSINEELTDPEAFEMHLVLEGTGIPTYPTSSSTTSTSTTTSPTTTSSSSGEGNGDSAGIPFSNMYFIILGIIALPVIRRKIKG